MKTIETQVDLTGTATLTVPLPAGISRGTHSVVVVIDEASSGTKQKSFQMPVISVGTWPDNVSLRREDMYGDDGR